LFVLPSLVASIILHHESVSKDLIIKTVNRIYPFLKAELFLHFEENDVRNQVEAILTEFSAQRIVKYESDVLQINRARV
ncbi:hypothetical protein GUG36_08265, partial [Xanthomonas citri pv. citri]|nr:hypothetical protein [Xanthomonas citri pv. citri]